MLLWLCLRDLGMMTPFPFDPHLPSSPFAARVRLFSLVAFHQANENSLTELSPQTLDARECACKAIVRVASTHGRHMVQALPQLMVRVPFRCKAKVSPCLWSGTLRIHSYYAHPTPPPSPLTHSTHTLTLRVHTHIPYSFSNLVL